jgi:hypothetical protein
MTALFIKCLTIVGVLSASSLFAQTAPTDTTKSPPLSISGQIDVYFRSSTAHTAALTSFGSAANSFGLGMANLVFAKEMGKVACTADVMFGPRAEAINYKYPSSSLALIKELFVVYKPTNKVKLTLGNFMTFIGYEYLEASNNPNYSMSYAYTNSPSYHTGLKADIVLKNNFSLMLGIFEPTDNKFYNPTTDKNKWNIGAQLAYIKGNFNIYVNALTGKSHNPLVLNESGVDTTTAHTTVFDITTHYQIMPKISLGANILRQYATVSEAKMGAETAYTSYVLYANYAATSSCMLAVRAEYFDDTHKMAALGTQVRALTFSANIKINALTLIPEIRFDTAKKAVFNGQKSDKAFVLAGVYNFF